MPAVIAMAAGAWASSAVATWIGTTAIGAVIGVVGATVIGSIAGGVIAGVVNNTLADDPQVAQPSGGFEAQARGILINVAGNVEPIPLVYGSRRVGGPRILTEVSGESNEYLHVVVVLGEGPVAAINAVYLDDIASTDARYSTLVTVEKYLGTDAQAASAALIAALGGKWISTDTLSGVAYIYVKLKYQAAAFPNGLPVITADVDGRTLYDPRDAGTRFSNNPALVIRDYLTNTRYGRGIPSASIDDTAFNTAANHCDERVTVAAHLVQFWADPDTGLLRFGSSEIALTGDKVQVSTDGTLPAPLVAATNYYVIRADETHVQLATSLANAFAGAAIDITTGGTWTAGHMLSHIDIARYTADGVVNVDQSPLDNYRALLTSCRGYAVFAGGKHKLIIDKAETPTTFEFTEDNIVGAWTIQPASKRTQVNRVKAQFFNQALRWQPDLELYESAAHRTADNGLVLESQIQLPFTASKYRAHMITQLEERQSRVGIVAKFRATVAGIQCEIGDVVPITHATPGWTAQPFRVMRIELLNTDEVDVTVRQYDAGVYSIDTPGEFVPAAATDLPNPLTIARQIPPMVSGLEIVGAPSVNEFTGRHAKFAWRRGGKTGSYEFGAEPWGGEGGLQDWYFKDFKVEIRHGLTDALLRTEYVQDPAYTYTYEHNFEDTDGTPTRNLLIKVWQRTKYDQISALPAQLAADNVVALAPTNIDLRANFKNIFFGYTPPAATDWAGVILWMSLSNPPSTSSTRPGSGDCVYVGTDPLVVLDASPQLTYYLKYATFDTFGKDGLVISGAISVATAAIETYDVAPAAITHTTKVADATDRRLDGAYTGSVGAAAFVEGVYTGVGAEISSVQTLYDLMFNWSMSFLDNAGHLQNPVMERIEYEAAHSADLGNLSVSAGTYGGHDCLVFTSAAALPSGVVSAGIGTGTAGYTDGAIMTIPGQPYMFVRAVDGPNKKIYASPDPLAAANVAYLVGPGTYPATLSVKFWGKTSGSSNVIFYSLPRYVTLAAAAYLTARRTEYGNVYYADPEFFVLSCRGWPTSASYASVYDCELIVNEFKDR